MFDIYLVIDLLVVITLVGLGVSALLQNYKAVLNRIFATFVSFIGIWIIANYVSNDISNSPYVATVANYFVFSCSFAAVIFLFRFASIVANNVRAQKLYRYFRIPLFLILATTPTPLVVQGVERQGSLYAVVFGPLIPLYAISLLLLIIATLYVMHHGTRTNTGSDKSRVVILSWSFFLALPAVVAMQLILPTVTGWFGLTNIGVTPMLFVVLGLFYSVGKHRLFDLRLVIIRTFSYLASLGVLVLIYGFITHYLQVFLLKFVASSLAKDGINAVLIALAAASYAPVRGVFNRVTNKLFYRDSYNSQEVLSQVSNIIVGNVDPNKIQRDALQALGKALKSGFVTFIFLNQTNSLKRGHVFGQNWAIHDEAALGEALKRAGKKIHIYEDLHPPLEKFRDTLRIENISVIAPLVTKDEIVGYLILGAKMSGNIYNSQDLNLLSIVTNELAIALQNAQRFEEIQAFNITLQDEVTAATRELKQTNKKLIALDEAKDEFISMASHQLRTPLTSIKGYLSMLSDGDMGKLSAQQLKAVQEAFGSSQRMVFLIADFLNVSRIKTGKFVIERSKVDLAAMVTEELSQLKEMFEAKDFKLSYEPPYDLPSFMLDDNKMRQVMMNMIDNAIYYTPNGGSITVQLYKTADELIFKVIDTGIGVSKAEQHKLFTKFFRASNAKKARPDGTGLGLFMAQKIIVEQGGAVIFESVEDKGSTFGFRFPLAKIKA